MKKKIELKKLSVQSFVTDMKEESAETVKGGHNHHSNYRTYCTICYVYTAHCGGTVIGIGG